MSEEYSNVESLVRSGGGKRDTAVVRLVRLIEAKAAEKGLNVSRWESHNGNQIDIVWLLHHGRRTAHHRFIPPSQRLYEVRLVSREGISERCDAYKLLMKMFRYIERHRDEYEEANGRREPQEIRVGDGSGDEPGIEGTR